MPGWLSVVLVIAAVLGVLMMKERLRMGALEKWAKAKGLAVRSPILPQDSSPAWSLAGRFTARGARRWGAAVEGIVDGIAVTIAEFETTWAGARETRKWQTIAFWASAGTPGVVVIWRVPASSPVSSIAPSSSQRVDERLGVDGADPGPLRYETEGGLLVEAEPAVRERWLTEERRRALEAWSAGGELARDGAHAAWRMEGTLSAALLDRMTANLPAARKMLA